MLSTAPSIKVRSFLQVAPYLAERGVSSIEFFRHLGISPYVFQNPDGWLPRKQCFHLAGEMVAVTGDPFGGARVGALTDLRSLGLWGQSVVTSNDIAHACAVAAANASMLQQGSDVRFVVEGGTARIHFRFAGHCELDPAQFILGSLAVLRKVPLLAGEPSAIRVHLSSAKARGADALEQSFGPNIEMGGEHDMIEFDRGLLGMPLRVERDDTTKVSAAIRSSLQTAGALSRRLSDHGGLKLDAVARDVGLSVRTLQRRLKECGVDFKDLLDETRRDEALRLISEGDHTKTEIAYRLGYSDPAHFTRAFKRWTGSTPSRYPAEEQ